MRHGNRFRLFACPHCNTTWAIYARAKKPKGHQKSLYCGICGRKTMHTEVA